MANRNISATVQIGATMASSVGAVFGRLGKQIDGLGGSLAKIKRQSSDITKLQTAQGRLAEAKAKGNAAATARYSAQIEKLSTALKAAGVDTSRLTSEQARLASAISSSEARLSSMTRIGAGMNRIRTATTGVGTAFANVRGQVMGLTAKMTALGAVTGYIFKTQFVDTAAEFERLQTILTTLEGGNVTKAKQAFGWISEFAAKTPYDLKQVSEAFVRLRAYGIDPIKGDTLKTLGDTAASMGKDVMSAVEAIADAVTGENERLKEFGIKAAKDGAQIIYSYTDRAGKQRKKTVDAGNREVIRSTLTAIWNEKYAGAMEAQSKTWAGMMSNMSDQWTRFTSSVMAEGVFDWMKAEVGGVLDELNKAAADGRLKAWAKETGNAIKEAFISLKEFAIKAKGAIVAVKDFVGGWKNLGVTIGAVALLPTIASVVQLGSAMWALSAASWAVLGPWGLLAIAGIGATVAVVAFRKEIREWMDDAPGWAKAIGHFLLGPIGNLIVYWDKVSVAVTAFKTSIGSAIDWAVEKIESLMAKLRELATLNIGGISFGDIGSTMLDLNPITGPARLGRRALDALMPSEQMPSAGGAGTVNNNVNVQISAPNSDGPGIERHLRANLPKRPLYDTTGTLVPQ